MSNLSQAVYAPQTAFKPRPRISNWGVFVGLSVIHFGALLVFLPQFFSWSAVIVFGVLAYLTGTVGITLGYHRMLTHRSLQMPKFLERFVILCGALCAQGSPIEWVATHRVHHINSDREGDPHNSREGFMWAHMHWLYIANGAMLSREQQLLKAHDVAADPFYRFLDRYIVLIQILLAGALFIAGGFPWLIWGMFFRLVVTYHITWMINSAAHGTGYQTYKTRDRSTNCWWLALLGAGEGWHNNHHAFPFSARHGLRWFEIDHTWHIIKLLSWLGLANRVRLPTKEMQERAAIRNSGALTT